MAVLAALVVILFMVVVHCRRAEQKISHLAMVVEQAGEGIALANLDGVVEYVNNAWLVMHGYEDDRGLVGKHLSIFHTEEQMEMDVTPFNDTARDIILFLNFFFFIFHPPLTLLKHRLKTERN